MRFMAAVTRGNQRIFLRYTQLSILVSVCLGIVSPVCGQQSVSDTIVQVLPQGEFTTFWHVDSAGLHEDFETTQAYVKIKNISTTPLNRAILYAEYFDG